MPRKAKRTSNSTTKVKKINLDKDKRVKINATAPLLKKPRDKELISSTQVSSVMFFKYNESLGPPYHILLDTNFITFCIKNKMDIVNSLMDCLLAKCIPSITECVIGELEKLGTKFKLALTLTKDPRFKKLKCDHKGTYADDCIVKRVIQHKCYLVATCDNELRSRIRKVPGVPIINILKNKCNVERLPDVL
eukprot:TRINITY_DN8190_c0_g1_i1.p1 TRINITY_DN8190_c0_g1~~TRINITY_DN8190_c0_g1_i1.p1  ORF type:complete len:192 (-),score=53.22 TRINITY_DN8190_c0_g1_i1:87-662(-)